MIRRFVSQITSGARRAGTEAKILVVGQTPPPHHGQAIMIERLISSKMDGVQMIHVRMAFSSAIDDVGKFRVRKLFHLLAVICRILRHRIVDGAKILYYPPAGPDRVPMLRDFVILLPTRWLFDKCIFHFHATGICEKYAHLPRWQQWLFRRAYFDADMAVELFETNSSDAARLQAKQRCVIPNGIVDPVSLEKFSAWPTKKIGEPLQILFVGALRESKGLSVLIEACGKLAARGTAFQLDVVGHWQNEAYPTVVARRIRELGLEQLVRFRGVVVGDDKFAVYRRADVFCFPTFFHCEAFPVVLLEAMACSLPIVATCWRGIPAIVDDGRTGFLVDPHDPDAVADRLARLAQDAGLCQRMGTAGRERFLQDFTLARHIERMRKVFLETAGFGQQIECQLPTAVVAT